MNQTLSNRIRKLRELRGFSQRFIASKMGITQQAYSVIEKNPMKSSLYRLQMLAKVLDVSMATWLEEEAEVKNFHTISSVNREKETRFNEAPNKETIHMYERALAQLKDEIQFLRKVISSRQPSDDEPNKPI